MDSNSALPPHHGPPRSTGGGAARHAPEASAGTTRATGWLPCAVHMYWRSCSCATRRANNILKEHTETMGAHRGYLTATQCPKCCKISLLYGRFRP